MLNSVEQTELERSIYGVNHVLQFRQRATSFWIEPSLWETRYIIFSNQEGRVWYIGS
jgi:hypothetical protein